MQKWAVISNCQTLGLANSFMLQNPSVHVEACDNARYGKHPDEIDALVEGYDALFVLDEVLDLRLSPLDGARRRIVMPSFEFGGYHPDLCYVMHENRYVRSPLVDYHSMICLAAFQLGLQVDDTIRLFNGAFYESVGFFDTFSLEATRLIARFAAFNFDIAAALRAWAMRGAFCYSFNHPKIECLYDLAFLAATQIGAKPTATTHRPVDNLASGPVFAVYPEIGEQLGVEGSYMFKQMGLYRLINLDDFIRGSYIEYEKVPIQTAVLPEVFRQRFDRVKAAIMGGRR